MQLYMLSYENDDGVDMSAFIETDQGPEDARKICREWEFVANYADDPASLDPVVFAVTPKGVRGMLDWQGGDITLVQDEEPS